jgi:hypothetical protein
MCNIIQKYTTKDMGNNILEIDLGLLNNIYFNKNINIIYFEKMLFFFKNKVSNENINQKKYHIYYDDDKILIVFANGSSVSNKININSYEISNANNIHLFFKTINVKKIPNDNFEPKYSYDKIESIDSIIFKYLGVEIEFIKKINKNVKFNIKIVCNNSNRNNLENILKLFILD